MACSTSEIVFWSTGGIVLLVLIGIGIAEMCRKWNTDSSRGSCAGGGGDVEVHGDHNVVIATDETVVAQADPQPIVRTARHEMLADVHETMLSRGVASTVEGQETVANKALDEYLTKDAFGATDGYEFTNVGQKLSGRQLRNRLASASARDFMNVQMTGVGPYGASRNIGVSTSVAQTIRGSKNCDGQVSAAAVADRIQDGGAAIAFNQPDAFALVANSTRGTAAQ